MFFFVYLRWLGIPLPPLHTSKTRWMTFNEFSCNLLWKYFIPCLYYCIVYGRFCNLPSILSIVTLVVLKTCMITNDDNANCFRGSRSYVELDNFILPQDFNILHGIASESAIFNMINFFHSMHLYWSFNASRRDGIRGLQVHCIIIHCKKIAKHFCSPFHQEYFLNMLVIFICLCVPVHCMR